MALRPNKGFHPVMEQPFPYLFVDACIQSWPDADYDVAHKHLVTAYGVTAFRPYHNFEDACEGLMEWHLVARKHPNMPIVTMADDIRKAKAANTGGIILAAQGGGWVSNKIYRIETFYRLGLRIMLPAYNADNTLCGGCLDSANLGLTRLGELFVKESNRVGLLLDGSHVAERACLEMTDASEVPIIYSHSNCAAIVPNPRNITDEQITTCLARGGVVCVAPFGPFLLKPGKTTRPTVDDLVEHVDHIAQLVGNTDGIGIGTDMSLGTYNSNHGKDPWGAPDYKPQGTDYVKHISGDSRSPLRACEGFDTFSEAGNLADRLKQRGYTDADLHKIFGENLMRVFDQVWKPVPELI